MDSSGLVLHGVTKQFQRTVAVDHVTLTVPRGSMFGLLGANGAGKTTTLRMILNILTPDEGTITWRGRPVNSVPRHTFGYLPEERGLYLKMKVGEELVFLAGLNDISGPDATRRAHEWLERVSLDDAWNRKVEELSKGNQQKVQVLAALLHDPELLLMDEPFSGLDPINTDVLRDTLLERQVQGRTIIFSSHRLEQVEELCDHVAIIHRGRLLLTGPLSDLKRRSGRTLVEIGFSPQNGTMPDLNGLIAAMSRFPIVVQERRGDSMRVELADSVTPDRLLQLAIQHGPGNIRLFELVEPSLQEIFIAAVRAADPEAVAQLEKDSRLTGSPVLTEG